jgi:hypothetical protein
MAPTVAPAADAYLTVTVPVIPSCAWLSNATFTTVLSSMIGDLAAPRRHGRRHQWSP